MEKTLFEQIIDREIPATIEYEDDRVIAIRDIQPSAKLHLLVIPKKPIPSVNDLTDEDAPLIGHIYLVAQQLAKKFNVSESGYRIVSNVNADAGQTVFHLHFHLLGGQPLGRMNSSQGSSHAADPSPASSSRPYRAGFAVGRITRDAGIMLLAAIGLAIVFNSMNPKAITWIKKDFDQVEASSAELEKFLGDEMEVAAEVPATEGVPVPTATDEKAAPQEPTEEPVVKNEKPTGDVAAATPTVNKQKPAPTEDVETQTKPAPSKTTEFQAEPGLIREISHDAFVKFLKKPHYLIDARRPEAYAEGYIADAKNIYGGEVQGNIPMILEMVPRDRIILIYCDGGDECELSHHVADVLKQFGYGPMFIYKGGWNEWILKNK